MRIFKLRSMKTINLFALLTALLFSATIWAEDYSVGTENELRNAITDGDKSNLFLSTDNTLYYPVEDNTIKPFRAYFHVDLSGGAEIKAFVLRFGDETTSIQHSPCAIQNDSDSWYDLQGRRIAKPANGQLPKGIYIHGGKAVVVK